MYFPSDGQVWGTDPLVRDVLHGEEPYFKWHLIFVASLRFVLRLPYVIINLKLWQNADLRLGEVWAFIPPPPMSNNFFISDICSGVERPWDWAQL